MMSAGVPRDSDEPAYENRHSCFIHRGLFRQGKLNWHNCRSSSSKPQQRPTPKDWTTRKPNNCSAHATSTSWMSTTWTTKGTRAAATGAFTTRRAPEPSYSFLQDLVDLIHTCSK